MIKAEFSELGLQCMLNALRAQKARLEVIIWELDGERDKSPIAFDQLVRVESSMKEIEQAFK